MKQWINQTFRWYYKRRYKQIQYTHRHGIAVQKGWLGYLTKKAATTQWGIQHKLSAVRSYADFQQSIPIHEYDDLKPYIQRMMHGEKSVLWPGQVRWFAKSSGTTSDKSKFIPISSEHLKTCHIKGTWDTMTAVYHNRPDARQFELKSMLMGGSVEHFSPFPGTIFGDVSAIMIKHMPQVARPFFIPDFETALLADWEKKLELLAQAGSREPNVVMIGGVPTWTIVLFKRILEISGKSNMLEVWPNFQVYIHGGVSFKPYRPQFEAFFPSSSVDYLEIYNASEGYFAVQDDLRTQDMLLLLDNGIFYEFLPLEEWDKANPEAITLADVEPGRNYALVISTNGGLWRYVPGDTIQFTSVRPYKIKITGRIKQFINAFGEEVMIDNTDQALALTCETMPAKIMDYTVAPVYMDGTHKGGHQWLIEFKQKPDNLDAFSRLLDENLQRINSDYEAKRFKNIALTNLNITPLPEGSFAHWLKSKGKLGGQNKVPRLSNDRKYVDEILHFLQKSSF
jgi:hypothetical protein